MHGQIVAQGGRGGHGVVFVLIGQLHKSLVGFRIDDRPLFDPPNLVFVRFDFVEAPVVVEHFKLLAIGDLANAVGDRSDAVMQVRGAYRDVNFIVVHVPEAVASGQQRERAQAQRQNRGEKPVAARKADKRDWKMCKHSPVCL